MPYLLGALILALIVKGLMPKPIPVETALVAPGPLTVSVLEEGKTRIRHRFVISAPVPALLDRIELRPGARVKKGEQIASFHPLPSNFLDPRAKSEAEARLEAAKAVESRSAASIQKARASLDLAEKEQIRSEELKRTGVISSREWDAARNQVEVLSRALKEAEFGLKVAQFERAQAEATLAFAQGDTGSAADLKILAPVTGYILNVYEESARPVTPGLALLEVGDPEDLEAEIELLSSDAVGVRPGAAVSIEQWGGERPLKGRVVLVEPGGYTKISALGVEEQRVKVRVEFAEPIPTDHPLGDRFRVEARIETWHGDQVLQIPTGALFRKGNQWMTYRLQANRARLTKVQIAHNNGASAEVVEGLQKGDRVIVHPPETLADGVTVKLGIPHNSPDL